MEKKNNTAQSLKVDLISSFDNIRVAFPEAQRIVINADKDSIHAVLGHLNKIGYDHLALMSCVDWIQDNEIELVYILSAYTENQEKGQISILVKTRISREKSEFQTITGIFENAEPYERELHELYGIHFTGHHRLIPLFLERYYPIPPFRKDFDTRKYVEEVFGNIPFVRKNKEGK